MTSTEVATQQMIAASKPIIDVPTVDPNKLPYVYNANDWSRGDSHWEGLTGTYMDLWVDTNNNYVIHKDLLDTGSFEGFIGSLGGYFGFQESHTYQGCYVYKGSHPGLVYGQKYLLYKENITGEWYYVICK